MAGIVAIMGRPNVGKSTLFNRLVGARDALVDPMAGLTRDLRERECLLGDVKVSFIDTAGLDEEKNQLSITAQMTKQALTATEQADLVIFVVDGRSGLVPADEMWAQFLRKKANKIVLVANKCESREKTTSGQLDALRLGLGDALPISAEHNMGMGALEEEILSTLAEVKKENPVPEEAEAETEAKTEADDDRPRAMKLAIIGRPNAGKSSLVNHLLGTKRQLTDAEAGTTRDSIAIEWAWEGKAIKLYDTAGLRRRTRIFLRAEKLSVSSALQAIRFSDIVVLLLDAQKPFETQDLRLAELIVREGRGLVLAVNKIDLMPGVSMEDLSKAAEHYLPQMRGVPLAAFSVKTGKGTDRLMPKVIKAHTLWQTEIKTAPLNAWLQTCVTRRPPPSAGGRAVRVKYITQKSARPPSFIIFTSRQKKLPDDYIRYLANDMRRTFNFEGTPVRIEVRASVNPYV